MNIYHGSNCCGTPPSHYPPYCCIPCPCPCQPFPPGEAVSDLCEDASPHEIAEKVNELLASLRHAGIIKT